MKDQTKDLTARNYSTRKVAVKSTSDSYTMYHHFFHGHPLPMFIADAEDYKLLDLNEAATRQYGYTREDISQMTLFDIAALLMAEDVRMGLNESNSFPGEDRHLKKNGEIIDVEIHANRVVHEERSVWLFTASDVTEKKKAERELKASNLRKELLLELQKQLLEINPDKAHIQKKLPSIIANGIEKLLPGSIASVCLIDEGTDLLQSMAMPSLPEEVGEEIGEVLVDLFYIALTEAEDINQPLVINNVPSQIKNYTPKKIDNKHSLQSALFIPVASSENKMMAVLSLCYLEKHKCEREELETLQQLASVVAVILEKRHVEEHMRVMNERYELIKLTTNEMLWSLDLKSGEMELNDGLHRLFGYGTPEVTQGMSFMLSKVHPTDYNKVKYNFFGIDPERKHYYADFRFKKADNSYANVEASAYLISNELGEPLQLVGSLKDVTKQKELEQRLIREKITQQKRINEALLEGSERQRSEISMELHDGVNQILSSAKLYMELAITKGSVETSFARKGVQYVMDSINEIRRLSHELAPPGLRQLGLIDAIEEHVRSVKQVKAMKISFDCLYEDLEEELTEEAKLSIYRIVQEQTNNILKYAKASSISIELLKEQNNLVLLIEDDGIGFDVKKVAKGIGLANITSRAEMLNGVASIDSAPGKGCKVKVVVPVVKE